MLIFLKILGMVKKLFFYTYNEIKTEFGPTTIAIMVLPVFIFLILIKSFIEPSSKAKPVVFKVRPPLCAPDFRAKKR